MADGAPATPRAPPGQRTVNSREPLGSVVIPARDEARVIRRTLDALFTDFEPSELEVIVVCNGCADDTARVARASGHPVRVRELRAASKPAALRCADAEATAFPRLYLDADVLLPGPQRVLCLSACGPGRSPPDRQSATR